jgi:hypothetical protein
MFSIHSKGTVMRTFLLTTLALAGCVTEGDEGSTDLGEPDVSTTESALCGAYGSPPAANWTHNFGTTDLTVYRTASDYGSTACANYVVKLLYGGYPTYDNGSLRVSFGQALPTSAYACVATSVTVRRYSNDENGDPEVETVTNHGEWTANGCVLAARSEYTAWESPTIEISAQRASYCPNGGPYCATAVYGLPVALRAQE